MTPVETLRDTLLERAQADPDRLGYHDGRRGLTYAEVLEGAAAKAGRLAALGVRPRDRVAISLPSGLEFVETFWAVQLLGAASCALNPYAPETMRERRAAQVRPRLVVTDGLLDDAPPAEVPDDPEIGREDTAFLQLTSGTTGSPRAAVLQHGPLLDYMAHQGKEISMDRDDVVVAWVPPWHDLGLVRFTISVLRYSVPSHIVQPAIGTIPLWLETVGRVGATFTGAPDFAFRIALRTADPAKVDLSTLLSATNGGEPINFSTIQRFEERFGLEHRVVPGYGLAEAMLGVATCAVGEAPKVDEHGNVSCGRAIGRVELKVDGDAGQPGEVLVRTPYAFAGYFDAPDETREVLDDDGWLHTGDLGYLDADGELFVLGRAKAMIKRAGAVVAPRELEEAALGVEGVRLAAAVGIPGGEAAGEKVVVVVEAGDDADRGATAAGVSKAIVATVGFAPSEVLVVPRGTIPRTLNGKVRHIRLKAMVSEGLAQAEPV